MSDDLLKVAKEGLARVENEIETLRRINANFADAHKMLVARAERAELRCALAYDLLRMVKQKPATISCQAVTAFLADMATKDKAQPSEKSEPARTDAIEAFLQYYDAPRASYEGPVNRPLSLVAFALRDVITQLEAGGWKWQADKAAEK